MLTTALLVAFAASPWTPTPTLMAAPLPQSGKSQAPPGMVLIKGGRTHIGIDKKEALALGQENEEAFIHLAKETGAPETNVPDFYLGTTEVTNEQYHEFVKATGARPPESWGIEAINEASLAWSGEQSMKAQEAREKGLEFVRVKFDISNWWKRNWQDAKWEIPKGDESLPVAYIDYQQAEAYARWAGVRLMTEFEYQRAGRGNTKNVYPWGETWDSAACASVDSRLPKARPVGSYPGGATADGVYDLTGNLWEWTSSPFTPYERFEVLKIEVGQRGSKRTIDTMIEWDANQRVAVGGSFQNGSMPARLTTRRGSERDQSAEGLGFRVAASTTPGSDVAATVLRDDLPTEVRPEGVSYAAELSVGSDRWTSKEGTATTVGENGRIPIENYSIITSYDYILFVPVAQVDASATNALDKQTLRASGPIDVGMLSTTQAILEPALPAGTYALAYRGPGKLEDHEAIDGAVAVEAGDEKQTIAAQEPDQEPVQEPEPEQGDEEVAMATITYPAGFDPMERNLLVYDAGRNMLSAVQVKTFEYAKPVQPTVLVTDSTRTVVTGYDKNGKELTTEEPITEVTLKVNTPAKVSSRVFTYNIVLRFKQGQIGKDWRR